MSPLSASGTVRTIPDPAHASLAHPILAAGAVLMRTNTDGHVEVACVHWPRYEDWSLPKGKVDPGESIPQAAAREIEEETGHRAQLGTVLGTVAYRMAGRDKVVYYFTATTNGGEFLPNREVDELRWLPPNNAIELMSYELDRSVIEAAVACPPIVNRVILVRHAKALSREQWVTKDALRPLNKKGRRQAGILAAMLAGFRPTAVLSAPAVRCKDTAKPIAKACGLPVLTAAEPDLATIEGVTVLVHHKPDIQELLRRFARTATGQLPQSLAQGRVPRAGAWVLDLAGGQVVGAAFLSAAEPAK